MDLLLMEWSCSFAPDDRELLPEGYGMMRTLCSAFAAGNHSVTALVSRSISGEAQFLGANELIFPEGDAVEFAESICSNFDASFVVAPESHGILSKLSAKISSKCKLLSCSPATVDLLSDKAATFNLVSKSARKLSVPPFLLTEAVPRAIASAGEKIGYPSVLKPTDGAGSKATSIMRSPSDVRGACARLCAGGWKHGLIQRFVRGRHLSASFIADGSGITPLSINTQTISLSDSVEYTGGSCPYPLPFQDILWDDLDRLIAGNDLRGPMGMDFVLDGENTYFMEINPRVTTSYIGIAAIEPDLGLLILGKKRVCQHKGYAHWAIMPLQKTVQRRNGLLSEILREPSVVSPPFPVGPYYIRNASKILACVWAPDSFELSDKINGVKASLAEVHIAC